MVARIPIRKVRPEALYLDRLPKATREAFLFCAALPFFKQPEWYLAGGTALTLQVGHRQSVDLDFFSTRPEINVIAVERELFSTGVWNTTHVEKDTLYGTLKGAKLSLIAYPFFVPTHQAQCGTIRMLEPEDVASMKIIALSQRGRKRDFVDLYWYAKHRESLETVIRRALRQYPGQKHNIPHFIKSLAYFVDAEKDAMPRTYFKVSWEEVKKFFKQEAVRLACTAFDI